MSDPIVVEVTDKVNSGISKKIKDIAASARDAQSKVDSLQSAINSLNGNALSELTKQFKSVTSSLREELDMLKAATKAAGDNSLATAKLATEQQKLATEVAKTGMQSAKTAVETAKLTAAQNSSALAAQKLATEQSKTAKALADAEGAAARTAAAKQRLSDTQNKTVESSLNLANAFKLLIASAAVSEYIKMSDAVTNLQSRLKLVTSGAMELAAVQEQLYKTAQDSRTSYIELGMLYSQIARSAKDAGVSTQGLLGITKTISQAMTISGGSAESMKAALVQLSQGFASGVLRGEELNSVMEQTPRLAQAIADGLGIGIGKLREWGKEGKLTSEMVMGALEKSAAGVEAEFAKMTPTIGQAFTRLSNAVTKTTGEFNEASGASNLLAKGVSSIADAVDGLGKLIKDNQTALGIIAGGLGGAVAGAGLLAVAAGVKAVSVGILALNAALLANPATLALLGIGAAVGAGVAVANAWNKTETGITRTTEALVKQRDVIEKNLASGRLDEGQKKANLETLASVNKSITENNVKLDEMNGLYAKSSLRSQEIQTQNAAEATTIKKKTEAQDSFKKMMEGLSGVTDEYRKKEAEFNKNKHLLSEADQAAGIAALKKEYDKMTGATKAASSALKDKRAEDLFQIKNTIELNKLHGELAKKADSLINDYKKQRIGADELAKELKGLVETQEAYNLALANAKVRQAQVNKDYKDSADALADIKKADQERVKSLKEGNDSLEEEIQKVGLSARGLVQYAYAKNQAAIADLKAKRNLEDTTSEFEKEIGLIRETNTEVKEQLALLEKRGELILNKGIAEEIQTQKQAYTEFFADIERGLTDSLYNAFQNGGSFGKTFWEGIKNMFKTTVLKFAIQGVFGGISGMIGNLLGMSSGGSSAGGGLGAITNGASIASNAYGLYSQGLAGTSIGQLYSGYTGATLAPGMVGPSATPITIWSQGGNVLGGASTGTAAGGTATSGGGMGAFGVYAVVAALIANAVGAFRNRTRVDSGISGTLGEGDLSAFDTWRESGTLFKGPDYDYRNPEEMIATYEKKLAEAKIKFPDNKEYIYQIEAELNSIKDLYGDMIAQTKVQSKSIQDAYEALRTNVGDMADTLGISSEAVRKFTMTLGSDVINSDTGKLGMSFKGLTEEEIAAKISEALATANNTLAEQIIGTWKTVTRTYTERIDNQNNIGGENQTTLDPTYTTRTETSTRYVASEYARDGEKAIDTLTRLATSLKTVNGLFDMLGVTLLESSLKGGDIASKLADVFGGLENMTTLIGDYYSNFYSESEQMATMTRQLTTTFEGLNLKLPTSREEYRKLVESQDLTTEAGRKMYAKLIELSGAFAAISDAAKDTEAAAEAAAKALDIANRKFDLQNQLLELQGKSREALDARRNKVNTELMALDPALAKLQYEIWLLEDAASAAADETERLRKAEEERKAALSSAYTALQNAITAEKALISEQITATNATITSLQQIFDVIHQSVVELRGDVSSTKAMQLSQANALIDTAYTTGVISDNTKFSEALTTARASLVTSNFATQGDYDNAVLTLIAKLSSLEGSTSGQLTDAQRQLNVLNEQSKQLDATLEYWKKQIDIANGTYTATLSVAEAVANLSAVIGTAIGIKPVGTEATTNGGSFGGGGGSSTATGPTRYQQVVGLGTSIGYSNITDSTLIAKLDQLAPIYHSFDGTGNLKGLLTAIKDAGGTMQHLSALSGYFVNDWIKAGASVGIPAFASGGYHSGGAFIGNEYGAELMYSPGALNIHNAADTAIMADNGSIGFNQLAVLLMQVVNGNTKNAELLDKILESNKGSEEDIEAVKNTLISVTDSRGTDAIKVVQ